jgi:DNA mismatch endonuclease (patch repair protein)
MPRRKIDIAFTRQKLAVFVDGCFWHACPEHGVMPKANQDWWRWKLQGNVTRDSSTNQQLAESGWRVLRFWEHEAPQEVAAVIAKVLAATPKAPR